MVASRRSVKYPLTLFRIGFLGLLTDGEGAKGSPVRKICHTYPLIMKLGTIIPYPKKIHKIYESRDTTFEFCWYQYFFAGLLHKDFFISIFLVGFLHKCFFYTFWYIISIYFNSFWVFKDFYNKHGWSFDDASKNVAFFERWSWFKFNNLGLVLGTNVKFCTSVTKGLKLKVRKFWGLIRTFVEVTGEKLVGRVFLPARILNRVNI